MTTARVTAAARRRQEVRLRRKARRSGPQLREEETTFEQLVATPRRRTDPPVSWPGATRFSDDAHEFSPVAIVRLAKRCPLLDELRERCDFSTGWGRAREPGEAALAYLAFVLSGQIDLQPWWSKSAAELWWECGFAQRPNYDLIRDRFLELEAIGIEVFFEAGAKLIRHAIERSGGLAAVDLFIDCTESESNVRLHHDCRPSENCPGWKHTKRNRHGAKIEPRANRNIIAPSATTEEIKSARQKTNREVFDPDADLAGDVDDLEFDPERGFIRVRFAGHWWRCRDYTAGVRAISGKRGAKKSWVGFHSLKLGCRTFSAPIVHLLEDASIQEHELFDEVLERALHITGENHMRSISFDAGFAIKDVYRRCTEHGITGIGPYRRHKLSKAAIAAGTVENDTPHD